MSRGQTPWVKLYPARFMADPYWQAMTSAERGMLWALRLNCWEMRGLPLALDTLALLCRETLEVFKAAWERVLKQCFGEFEGKRWPLDMWDDFVEKREYAAQQALYGATRSNPQQSKQGRSRVRAGSEQGQSRVEAGYPDSLKEQPQKVLAFWTAQSKIIGELESLDGTVVRVLREYLRLRCEACTAVRDIRTPASVSGWKGLAKILAKSPAHAVRALEILEADNGIRLRTYFEMAQKVSVAPTGKGGLDWLSVGLGGPEGEESEEPPRDVEIELKEGDQ